MWQRHQIANRQRHQITLVCRLGGAKRTFLTRTGLSPSTLSESGDLDHSLKCIGAGWKSAARSEIGGPAPLNRL